MWWEENAVGVGIDEHQRFNTCALTRQSGATQADCAEAKN